MDKYQAEKIVKEYGGAIANDKNVFKKSSTLPCSKAKIRYAFFVLINAVVKEQGHIKENIGQNLVAIYCMLDSFVSDKDADRLNKILEIMKNKQLDRTKPEYNIDDKEYSSLVINTLRNGKYFDEINEYIEECYKARN